MAQNLYLSNCYEDRLEIGRLVLIAAKKMGGDAGKIAEAHTLINDIGWTKALCEDYSAWDDISSGAELLEDTETQDAIILRAKANRYLGSISVAKGNIEEAKKYFIEAKKFCEMISEQSLKDRFSAGIMYAEAEMHLFASRTDYQKAYEVCEQARNKREQTRLPNDDRYIRSFAQKGKILYFAKSQSVAVSGVTENTYEQIRLIFLTGLSHAESAHRIDEIKKNSYGIACCLMRLNQEKAAQKVIDDFIEEYGDIELFETDDKLVHEYVALKNKKHKKGVSKG